MIALLPTRNVTTTNFKNTLIQIALQVCHEAHYFEQDVNINYLYELLVQRTVFLACTSITYICDLHSNY